MTTGNTGGQTPDDAASIRDRLRAQADETSGDWDTAELGGHASGTATPGDAEPAAGDAPHVGHHKPELTEAEARSAERKVAALFMLALVGVVGFVATFALGTYQFGEPGNALFTPLLGIFMTLALVGVGAGAVLWAKTLMVDDEQVQERHPFNSTKEARGEAAAALKQGLSDTGLPRRKLLRNTLLVGAGSLAVLPVPFVFALGSTKNKEQVLGTTGWERGTRMIRANGTPVRVGDLQVGGVESVFPDIPHGTLRADSPTLLIRMRPEELQLEGQAQEWAFEGHVAYSSICTHLGCPVKLYEQQTHNLLCPCHQSTFSASRGGIPLFGPAARALPQLAITLDDEGYFVAAEPYQEPIGPSYWERNS